MSYWPKDQGSCLERGPGLTEQGWEHSPAIATRSLTISFFIFDSCSLYVFQKTFLRSQKKFRIGKPFCIKLQSQQRGDCFWPLLSTEHLTLCFNKVLLTKSLCVRTLTYNIGSNLGQNSDQQYYFIYPLNFTHLFISNLWIQLKIQVNFFSRLDLSYIKAKSQKLVIWCKSILIADCQLQDVLRREAEKDVNAVFWDYWAQKEGLARVSMQPSRCSMWTDSCDSAELSSQPLWLRLQSQGPTLEEVNHQIW